MPQIALVLYGVFLFLAFGLRTLVHYRQTGSSGLRLPPPGASTARAASVLFVLALLLGVLAPVLALIGLLEPLPVLDVSLLQALGLACYFLGALVTVWAQFAMGTSWRIGVDTSERTTLVTRGPFSLVRNPIFSGMLLAATGLTLLVPNVLALAALFLLFLAVELQVRSVEEPYLLRTHVTYSSMRGIGNFTRAAPF